MITKKQLDQIREFVILLSKDDSSELVFTDDSQIIEYLNELVEKEGSLRDGLVYALEYYLEK